MRVRCVCHRDGGDFARPQTVGQGRRAQARKEDDVKSTADKQPKPQEADCTIGMRMNLSALLIIERGLIALGDFPQVRETLADIRRLIPTPEYVDTAEQIMQPTSLTGKIETGCGPSASTLLYGARRRITARMCSRPSARETPPWPWISSVRC